RTVQVDDRGDVQTAADDRCTRTEFAENAPARIVTLVSRVETVSVACAAPVDRGRDVLGDDRTLYDGRAFGAAPDLGNPTLVQRLATHNGTTATYATDAEGSFDPFGRPLVVKDSAGTE